jgi:hypothetical protein
MCAQTRLISMLMSHNSLVLVKKLSLMKHLKVFSWFTDLYVKLDGDTMVILPSITRETEHEVKKHLCKITVCSCQAVMWQADEIRAHIFVWGLRHGIDWLLICIVKQVHRNDELNVSNYCCRTCWSIRRALIQIIRRWMRPSRWHRTSWTSSTWFRQKPCFQ